MANNNASSTRKTGTVSIGRSTTGPSETACDTDWFRLTPTTGHDYQFDLMGRGNSTLADSFLEPRDNSGNSLTFADDGGTELDFRLPYIASTGGYGNPGTPLLRGEGQFEW